MMHGDQGPVGNDSGDAERIGAWDLASDEILYGGGIEKFDVGEVEDFGEEGRCKKSLLLMS